MDDMLYEVQAELDYLKSSTTFAMSLGARELFHTNFIAFILDNNDESLTSIKTNLSSLFFKPNIKCKSSTTRFYTWREKKNLDLIILAIDWKYDDKEKGLINGINTAYVCVIEAKLKSIPSVEQLEIYDEILKQGVDLDLYDVDFLQTNNGDCIEGFQIKNLCNKSSNLNNQLAFTSGKKSRLILSLCINKTLLSQISLKSQCPHWQSVTWCELAEVFNNALQNNSSTLDQVINEYARHVKHLAFLIKKVVQYSENNFKTSSNIPYRCLYCWVTHQSFKKIRIHDLVGKIVFNSLERRLSDSIGMPCLPNHLKLRCYTHYSSQQPGIGFEWQYEKLNVQNKYSHQKAKKIFSIGVQIQGCDYRHYISTTLDWDDLVPLSKSLTEWFYPQDKNCQYKFYGKQGKELYKFNEKRFIYSKKDIDVLTFDQLHSCLEWSMKLACCLTQQYEVKQSLAGHFDKK